MTKPALQRQDIPTNFGRYEVRAHVGSGGMSDVYRAYDPNLKTDVAVKVLSARGNVDPSSTTRFIREAGIMAQLRHRHIVTVYNFEQAGSQPYIVMELLRGDDLRTKIRDGRTGDHKNKIRICGQIAEALQYIHTKGYMHRDIKPANVHFDEEDNVKLIDFGIAKLEAQTDTTQMELTSTGEAIGTPVYMSPEMVWGQQTGRAADVFSYGVLIYELFAGIRPFQGSRPEEVFSQITQKPADLQPLIDANVPAPIITLISDCLAKNSEGRPQNFGKILARLDEATAPVRMAPAPVAEAVAQTQPAPQPEALPAPMPVLNPAPAESLTGNKAGTKRWLIIAAIMTVLVLVAAVALTLRGPAPLPLRVTAKAGEMALIPAGNFLHGPDKTVDSLPDFYIGVHEVSNADYERFAKETGRPLPPDFDAAHPDMPVVNVTIKDARDFAKWAGLRLPTMKEWEKAARGLNGAPYPWGEAADRTRANLAFGVDNPATLASVSAFPSSISPFGILQMVGNVWEFIDQPGEASDKAKEHYREIDNSRPPVADEKYFLMAGGSFGTPLEVFAGRATFDASVVPEWFRAPDIGFRCVKDVDTGK